MVVHIKSIDLQIYESNPPPPKVKAKVKINFKAIFIKMSTTYF